MSNIQSSTAGRSFNILLAEDELSTQFLLERILNSSGHSVTVANNGEEALSCLTNNSYDIGIFDMQMPIMGGIEAIKKYKEKVAVKSLPFIMLTATNKEDALKQCESVGVDVLLIKPTSSQDLLTEINRVCSK